MMDKIADIVVAVCLFALFVAILINFMEARSGVEKKKRSIVETGSMTGFFVVFYLLIRFRIGHIDLPEKLGVVLRIAGLIMIVAGCAINIHGRFSLGRNWANQVTIYSQQQLVTRGMYQYVRHPLYSSIILMFYGACLAYPNYLAFISNTLIFIPFMIYRAGQEEKLLIEKFDNYKEYQKKTGMLFPKFKL